MLIDYYDRGLQRQNGLPSVKYCSSELCLSPGYFGDLIRETLGENPKDYIRGFVVMRAKSLLLSGMSVTQVSEQLGFEYPNHFTRLFKQITGQTPSQFLNESVAEPSASLNSGKNRDYRLLFLTFSPLIESDYNLFCIFASKK